MLQLQNVTKRYQLGNEIWELKDINFTVEADECIAITGISGSGKSTLLRLMGALDKPNEGEILFEGKNLSHMNDQEVSYFRNQEIGFVFQEYFLYPDINLVENVALPLMIAGENKASREAKALKALEEVGLKGLEKHNMYEISGGQRQRVAIARAIIHRPRLLLADEPTGNLDSTTGKEILELLQSLHHNHNSLALAIVTHSADVVTMASRHIELADGVIIKDEAITTQPIT